MATVLTQTERESIQTLTKARRSSMMLFSIVMLQLLLTMPAGVAAGKVKRGSATREGVQESAVYEVEIRRPHRRHVQSANKDNSSKEGCGKKESCAPSEMPSPAPSAPPTISQVPTVSIAPSSEPSVSMQPSAEPTSEPTAQPTPSPSSAPSPAPSGTPSSEPTISSPPTGAPSSPPTPAPTPTPSTAPSSNPTSPPSGAPTVSASPTVSAAPSPVPSSPPTSKPTISMSPSLEPTQDPTNLPTLDPFGYDTMFMEGPNNKTAFSSECRKEVPAFAKGLDDQLIAFSYVLNMEAGADPQLASDGVELRLQRELANEFLNCVFVSGQEAFFTHQLNSLPLDASLGLGSCSSDQVAPNADCYLVEAAFTATIFFLPEELGRDLLSVAIKNQDVYDEYKAFLEQVFASSVLHTPKVLSTDFAAITNTAAPSVSVEPTVAPTATPTRYPTLAPFVPSPVDWSSPTFGGPPSDVSATIDDPDRGILDDDAISIIWYVVAGVFALCLLIVLYVFCRERKRRAAERALYEEDSDTKEKSIDHKESYAKMDGLSDEIDSEEMFLPYTSQPVDNIAPARRVYADDESQMTGLERTLETYRKTQQREEQPIAPAFVPTQELIQNVSTDELNHAIDELYRPQHE